MPFQPKIDFLPTDTPQQIFDKILLHRGLTDDQAKQEFLHPSPPTQTFLASALNISPTKLTKFKSRLTQAKQNQEPVCIFGDYDADGITSTAILWQALSQFGLNVLPFIPHRQKHGYGLTDSAIQEILSGKAFAKPFKPSLIITTDTGIVAHDQIAFLKSQGIEVILTDHHQPTDQLPPADLIIHSTQTSAAGIAFLLAQTLLSSDQAWPLLELATIGVVADQMPLTGINRNLVFHGLKLLSQPTNLGLQALYQQAGLKLGQEINTYTIGFVLAPRINAMGRLSHGLIALRLLCSRNQAQVESLAKTLNQTNFQRQTLTQVAYQDALSQLDDSPLVVVASTDYHEGIIGLIAGKLLETTHKPTLALSLNSDLVKGSARSIGDFDITAFLRRHQHLLLSVGGHKLAAGFSLDPKNLPTFIKEIKADAKLLLKEVKFSSPEIQAEGQLHFAQLNLQLYQLLQQLAPFGLANPRPSFFTQAKVISSRFVGQQNQHLQLTLEQDKLRLKAIWFNAPSDLQPTNLTQFIFNLQLNSWQGRQSIQLNLKHAN